MNLCYQMKNGLDKIEKKDLTEMNLLAEASGRLRPGGSGILFLPFLTGSGSPYFCPEDRGTFLGLSTAAGRGELFRSVMEGVAFNIRESTELLVRMGGEADTVYVSGGGTHIRVWTQILTDVLGVPVHILEEPDASTLGAALTAAAGADPENDLETLAEEALTVVGVMQPDRERTEQYDRLYGRYRECCRQVHQAYRKWTDCCGSGRKEA